jgi:hypothetical protein
VPCDCLDEILVAMLAEVRDVARKTETWVSDRTGHDGHSMIERYRRKARTWNLGPLGALHGLIPELAGTEPPVRIARD